MHRSGLFIQAYSIRSLIVIIEEDRGRPSTWLSTGDMTASWKITDAVTHIDELHSKVQGAACSADTAVGQAKALWQEGRQQDAFQLLLDFIAENQSTLALQLPVLMRLKEMLVKVDAHLGALDSQITALQLQLQQQNQQLQSQGATIKKLVQDADKKSAERVRSQQQVLLGQIAYVFSGMAENFIYGTAGSGSLVPLSLVQIAKRADRREMTEAQQQLWRTLQQTISAVMPVRLIEADKHLRTLKFDTAHGIGAQIHETTLQMLQTWAGVHCSHAAVAPVQHYAEVLARFSTSNTPLAPDRGLSDDLKWQLG